MKTTAMQWQAECACNLRCPPQRVFRQPAFAQALACFYKELGLSGDLTVDWVLTELYDNHNGQLVDFEGDPIDLDTVDADGVIVTDELFGEDERRFINRFRERADKPFTKRLQQRILRPVMFLHFAREIYHCRTEGHCASG